MVNYQLGKIYKIVDNTNGKIYIGSTCEPTLSRRLAQHKRGCRLYFKTKSRFMTSFEILKNENYEIVLVENYPCNSKDELHARERYYIENNECVNKFIPTRTNKENREANKSKKTEQRKEYYNENKHKITEYKKQYHETNKEKVLIKLKKYREENIEMIKEKRKQLYTCLCGCILGIGNKSRHLKSQKHQRYLETK